MALAPPKLILAYVPSLQKDIKSRALAKQAWLAKQEYKKGAQILREIVLSESRTYVWA
jgi:hypothetical protein